MVYNTVLTAEKRGPQIVGAQISGVYSNKVFRGEYSTIWLDETSGHNYLILGKNYCQREALTEIHSDIS